MQAPFVLVILYKGPQDICQPLLPVLNRHLVQGRNQGRDHVGVVPPILKPATGIHIHKGRPRQRGIVATPLQIEGAARCGPLPGCCPGRGPCCC